MWYKEKDTNIRESLWTAYVNMRIAFNKAVSQSKTNKYTTFAEGISHLPANECLKTLKRMKMNKKQNCVLDARQVEEYAEYFANNVPNRDMPAVLTDYKSTTH
jgi:hypothetical protein